MSTATAAGSRASMDPACIAPMTGRETTTAAAPSWLASRSRNRL